MAGTGGRTNRSVIEQLTQEPERFDFFQAVRLLEWSSAGVEGGSGPIGGDAKPEEEIVRFRSLVSLAFPPSQITKIEPAVDPGADQPRRPPELTVSFMGLHGPAGVLPRHYTTHLLERCHVRRHDYAQRDFFDLFNHRTISLFYKAWEKYHFTSAYQRRCREGRAGEDLFTFCLLSLVGLGTEGLAERMAHDRQTIVYYGGHFAHRPRNATGLEAILCDYFQLPVKIRQYWGQWLYLSVEEQSSLPSRAALLGNNCELGGNAIVGERVWDVQSKFRLRVGPLDYATFARLMPSGDVLRSLVELTRLYVGEQFDFDVQAVLMKQEVPECCLAERGITAPRLGWNTWLVGRPPAADAEDAVFSLRS